MEIDMAMVALVVMEPGSLWPGHMGDLAGVVAFSQGGEELLRRTREELEALRHREQHVRVAVLACNAAADGRTVRRRTEVARALLAAVRDSGFGRLILSASSRASLRLREELAALAGVLGEPPDTSATVSLMFVEEQGPRA
jgi:hypothetical protein